MRHNSFYFIQRTHMRIYFYRFKPGEAGSIPQTVASKSYKGLELQAWQSKQVGPGVSAKVVNPVAITAFHVSGIEGYLSAGLLP